MQQRSKSTIVFAVVAVLSLGSAIASAGFGRGAHGRFADARAKLAAECSGTACERPGQSTPPAFSELKLGMKELEAPTASNLVRVLERADRIDRARTLVSSLLAAKLFDGVGESIEASPALLDDARLVAALRRSSFASAKKPLEAERLHALTVLAGVPAQVPIRTAGLAESTATRAMADVDLTLHAMEDSVLAGDGAGCERASERSKGLAKQVTVGPSICKNALRIVESSERLRALQARTYARTLPARKEASARL